MRPSRLLTVFGGFPLVLVSVAVATAILLPFRSLLSPAQVMLLFVPLLLGLAQVVDLRSSVAAALVAFLAVDLLFVKPYYRIAVASSVDWMTLLLFLVVTLIAGMQAMRMRRRETAALQREREISLLNRLSSRLVSEESVDSMASFTVHEVVAVLGADRAALYVCTPENSVDLIAEAGGMSGGTDEPVLADWVIRNDKAIALPVSEDVPFELRPIAVAAGDAVPGVVADGVFVPLQTPNGLEGVLFARSLSATSAYSGDTRQLLAVANLAAAFLEHRRLEEVAAYAAATRESDRLKATFVSSVSHELKTPLAAVTARVTGLLEEGEACDAARVRSELIATSEDLGRLDSSIRDLVDVSRLESDAWRPKPDLYDLSEVLGTVAARIPVGQRDRVTFEVPSGLPQVRVDFNQWARAVSNLVENALVYAPPDSPVRVGARLLGDRIALWVEDGGPGVPDEEKQQVFEKFYRGGTSGASPAGTGLGLAIVREIVNGHGGRAWVEDAEPHGARFVLSLPLEGAR
jgi:two-component system sensor histidine kinase KdpD